MKDNRPLYYIEDGRLFCQDIFDEPYEVLCTVEAFQDVLKMEGF